MKRRRCRVLLATLVVGCCIVGVVLSAAENAFNYTYDGSGIALEGRVVDSSGAPIPGCVVSLSSGHARATAADGTFGFSGQSRNQQLMTVSASGYYLHLQPIQLLLPIDQAKVVLPPIVLWPDTQTVVRFLFGGDTAFARRMLDPLERAPRDEMPIENPDALICVSNPLPGTLDVVRYMQPLFRAVDYPVINFESVITLDPSTPHRQKDYVYFTLPASLAALKTLNLDYIEYTDESRAVIAMEKSAGQIPVVQMHVGDEYTFKPSAFALSWMKFGVDAGADLIVSHHTHVAQGFGMYRGVLLVHSLGNLFFDQDRLETMLGLVATVDMHGHQLRRAWGTPVYIEDYRPRFMTGALTSVFLRRIGEFSQQLRVFPYNGQAWLADRPEQYSFQDRRLEVAVDIGTNGWTVLDLRSLASSEESLERMETESAALMVQLGRDLMNFGDFEDVDVDEECGEVSRWDLGSSSTVARDNPCRGMACIAMYRTSANKSDAVAAFRNRIRVMEDRIGHPNKAVSLVGYASGQSSGPLSIVSRYYAGEGPLEFGEEVAFKHPGGTFSWLPFAQDLHMPPDDPTRAGDPVVVNARAVRIFLHHSPPAQSEGTASFDEIAIVNWEEEVNPLMGPVVETPHARDFLRVMGPSGQHRLALTFRKYRPAEADMGHGPDLVLVSETPEQSSDHLVFKPTACGFSDIARLRILNRGNQLLVASNLAWFGNNWQDYRARFLKADGSTVTSPSCAIAPGTSAFVQVDFTPTSAGTKRATVQFKSNDPDGDQTEINIPVEGEASEFAAVRVIRNNHTLSPEVVLQIPATRALVDLVEERLPEGLIPTHVSGQGTWDPGNHRLQWRHVSGGTTLAYRIQGASNAHTIAGLTTTAERSTPTLGQDRLLLFASPDSDGDGLPDWWEHKFFDSRTGALPKLDSDRDGRNNLTEFQEATNPLDAGFQAQLFAPYLKHQFLSDGRWRLQVIGFPGTTYRLEASDDLKTWRVAISNLLEAESLVLPITNSPPTGIQFYRAAREEN